ncbi:uncharacterized protein [Dendrobates tinctorius]|uniref:uncharacterized protein n=1 Tax=Dendrobates tinctorius TaxID=92724 RepID=UPI003CCA49CF
MGLLIKSNTTSLQEIELEINNLQESLNSTLSTEESSQLLKQLENDFSKWEKEIVASKTKKYQRDQLDYKNNQVYRWRKKQMPVQSMPRTHHNSFSSASSMDEEPQSSGHRVNIHQERFAMGRQGHFRGKSSNKRKMTPPQSLEKKTKSGNALEVINLSTHSLTKNQLEVLSLGLNFVPTNDFNFFSAMKDIQLFLRKVLLRKLHTKSVDSTTLCSSAEQEALGILEELEQEGSLNPSVYSQFELLDALCGVTLDHMSLSSLSGMLEEIVDIQLRGTSFSCAEGYVIVIFLAFYINFGIIFQYCIFLILQSISVLYSSV